MPRQLPASPRAVAAAIAAFALPAAALPAVARAGHRDARARSASRSAAEREARAQEREALRAARAEERQAARAERQALRAQRRATRLSERAERRAGRGSGGPSGDGEAPSTFGTSAAPASTRGCSVTIQTSAARIVAGESVTVFGKVSCPSGGEAGALASGDGGQTLTIERSIRDHGAGPVHAFAAAGSVGTEADGSYQLAPQTLEANTTFRVRLGRHGAHATVRVAPVVTLNAPAPQEASAQPSSAGGHARRARRTKTVFTGTVAPAAPGARVALQVSYPADGEQWRTIAYGDVVDGGFSIVRSLKIPGEAKLRAIAHPKGPNVAGVSEALAYSVPRPQNPQLTIEASADPIAFGQSVTVSGVAAGAPGQAVTLLARTSGGSFAPVATSTTDEAGAYRFTQAPQQSTSYEVSDATTHSLALFEGVKYVLALSPPPAAVAAGEALTVSGSVTPARAGTAVYLERRGASGAGFHPIASATVAADGSFALAHTFESAGAPTLRVRIAGDAQLLGAASAPFTVTVGPSPASALAPEPAAPAS